MLDLSYSVKALSEQDLAVGLQGTKSDQSSCSRTEVGDVLPAAAVFGCAGSLRW